MQTSLPMGVTVVTPTLNSAKYLNACLRSVALQDHPRVEQLVVDGGSRDRTRDVVARYPHATFLSLPGSTQSEALNHGFREATYPVICWLNSDDVLLPGALEFAISTFAGEHHRQYLFSSFWEIDHEGAIRRERPVAPLVEHAIRNFAVYIPTSGSFFSRTIVEDGLWLGGKIDYLMDRDFIIRLLARGYRFRRSTRRLAGFRVHGEQKAGPNRNMTARKRERLGLDAVHGGVWIRGRRLLPWNPVLGGTAFLYVGGSARLSRSLTKLLPSKGRAEIEEWLARLHLPDLDGRTAADGKVAVPPRQRQDG